MISESDLLTSLGRNIDYLRWNCYRSMRYKLVYVATPKVACTSLKWWFASLVGVAQLLKESNGSAETLPELVIHDTFHKVAPESAGLSYDDLLNALTSKEYFRFAVVRNPFNRIFSAWQSKLLLREPLQSRPYLGLPFFESEIKSKDDLARAFEGFLEHLCANEAPNFKDEHWTPQAILLRPDIIEYSILARIEESDNLSAALVKWLGVDVSDPMEFRVANESLVPYCAEFITARSSELISSMYRSDFETFGYDATACPSGKKLLDAEFQMALKGINLVRGRHQRLDEIRSDMNQQISVLNEALQEQAGNLAVARKEVSELRCQNETALLELQRQVVVRDAEIEAQHADISRRDGEIASRDAKIAAQSTEITKRDAEIARRCAEIIALGSRIQDIEASLCWRITAPLRWLKQRMLRK